MNLTLIHIRNLVQRMGKDLEWLIHPVDNQRFFDEYLERKPLVIRRDDSRYYEELLTFQEVESILSSNSNNSDLDITLSHANRKIYVSEYATIKQLHNVYLRSGINTSRVHDLFEKQKATVIIHQAAKHWLALEDLSNSISRDLKCSTGSNVFVTPSQAQCFDAHYDEHDLMIIQISGKKSWKIYESFVPLPLEPQNGRQVDFSHLKQLYEFNIEPGDLIYIPRGFVHEVKTTSNVSTHITLGISSITWTNLLVKYIEKLGTEEATLRESFFASSLRSDDNRSGIISLLKEKIHQSLSLASLDQLSD